MFGVAVAAHGAAASIARLLLLVARAHVAGDVQLLPSVARRLVVGDLAGGLAGLGRRRLSFALRELARLRLGDTPGILLGGPLAYLLVGLAAALLLRALPVQPFALAPLVFLPLARGLRLLLGLAQPVDLLLLVARLVLEHFALHIGALAAHLDVDRAGAPLGARQLQLRLGFAPQRDLAGRGIGLDVGAAMTAAQMRQQFMLRLLADHVLRAVDLDPGLIELLEQPVDRYLQHLGELCDGDICHIAAPRPSLLRRTSACGRP